MWSRKKVWIGVAIGLLSFALLGCGCVSCTGVFMGWPFAKTALATWTTRQALQNENVPMDDLFLTHEDGNHYTGMGTNKGDRYEVKSTFDGVSAQVQWRKQANATPKR